MKILGHEYKVLFDTEQGLRRGSSGSCCPSTLTIWIDPTYPVSVQQESLLHEIEEALRYHLNCSDATYNHQLLSALSEARYQVIKDNPQYFTFNLGKDE